MLAILYHFDRLFFYKETNRERKLPMRRSLPFLVLLLATAAACSKSSPDQSPSQPMASHAPASADVSESAAPSGQASRDAGPNVGVTAAPGVAFNYHYAFS